MRGGRGADILKGSAALAWCGLFASLTAAGALVSLQLPTGPVRLTLQLFFVELSGFILGPQHGALSQIAYVLLGGLGLPVFAGGAAGPGVLFGPSGGYLAGFVGCAWVVGALGRGARSYWRAVLAMLGGLVVVYVCGAAWLACVLRLSAARAVAVGIAPFVLPDLAKVFGAAAVGVKVARRIRLMASGGGVGRAQ